MSTRSNGKRQPEWMRQGYRIGVENVGSTEVWCQACQETIRGLAVVLRKHGIRVPARIGDVVVGYDIMPSKDGSLQDEVWFHPKCWRKQSSSDRYATRIVGRWVAIYRAVEQAGSKGVPIKQIAMLTRINRSFVTEYLRKMVSIGKFTVRNVKRGNGRKIRYYTIS